MSFPFKTPFALDGNKTAIPLQDPEGNVNFEGGYTQFYEINPEFDPVTGIPTNPDAKLIERDKTNWLFYQITDSIRDIQLYGFPSWFPPADFSAYPLGAVVAHEGVVYRSTAADNTTVPGAEGANWEVGADALDLKANIESPSFTGNPTAPTPDADDDSQSIATTEYVQVELSDRVKSVATIADLREIDSTLDGINYAVDGSIFIYDASDTTSADDGYNIIVSTVAGSRYKRRPSAIHATSTANLRKIAGDLYDVAVLSESGITRIYARTESADSEDLPVIVVADDGSRWVESSYGQTLKNYSNLLGAVSGSGTNSQSIPRDNNVSFVDYFGVNQLKMARLEPEYFTPPTDDFNYINFGIWAENGGSIKTDFDASIYKNQQTRTYVYVNPWGGNDANDGLTWATAKSSVTNALNGTAETIYLAPGIYHRRTSVWYWRENNVRRNVNIICPNGRAVLSRRWEQGVDGGAVVWEDLGGGMFRTTRSSVASVYDTTISNFGDYDPVPRFTAVEDVAVAECGWTSQAGSQFYLKLKSGAEPSFHNCAIFIIDNYPCAKFSGENTRLYLENIDFEGGTNALEAIATDVNDRFEVVGKNCTFKYAYDGEGISAYGATFTAFQNCVAACNSEDGFSYHTIAVNGGIIGRAIEVDCVGRSNGSPGTATNNGSTLHDGWIAVRVNSSYYQNYGPNVPDVLGSKSWNVGVSSMDSNGVGSVQGFQSGDSDVYLDRCTHKGGGVGLLTNSQGRFYLRNTIIDGAVQLGGGSTLDEY